MQTHKDLAELAQQCAKQANFTSNRQVALEFWHMALDYQKRAADLDSGQRPDIGPPPSWLASS
jgi:hypothetical protein